MISALFNKLEKIIMNINHFPYNYQLSNIFLKQIFLPISEESDVSKYKFLTHNAYP